MSHLGENYAAIVCKIVVIVAAVFVAIAVAVAVVSVITLVYSSLLSLSLY